jgi:HKD family nuclease
LQIISNNRRPTHVKVINRLIGDADEIIICTAFLKVSGLSPILPTLKKKAGICTFYVGTDYYLTEPDALRELFRQGHCIYITKKAACTFHPKAYYFRLGDKITLITGSANLTGGGLETNFELSVLNQFDRSSAIDKSLKTAIAIFFRHSKLVENELEIAQYEKEFQLYRKKHKKAEKEFKEEIKNKHRFDLTQLDRFVQEYKDDNGFEKFAHRVENYKYAKRQLNEITRKTINSPQTFLSYYENIAKSFYSSGLLRGKTTLAKRHKKIISIIRLVQQNKNESPEFVFTKALPLVQSANRFGINALTEIMNTYNPNKFSVANGRTLKSLSDLEIADFPAANNFDTSCYKRYNDLITQIALRCGFKDLGQVDHFLSWYYGNYYEKP